jgi:aldehyde:ferredoxin oxidoreductase
MKPRKAIFVNTPQGQRHHGDVIKNLFLRNVDWKKDRMKIFDAWSIHPDALDQIKQLGVKKLKYKMPDRVFTISVSKAEKKGFTREFSGGITHYIPLKVWEVEALPQGWVCSRCGTKNSSLDNECMLCFMQRPVPKLKPLK